MHEGGRCNECIPVGFRVGDVQARASLCDGGIDRQDTIVKRRQNVLIHPCPQDGALGTVASYFLEYACLYFQN